MIINSVIPPHSFVGQKGKEYIFQLRIQPNVKAQELPNVKVSHNNCTITPAPKRSVQQLKNILLYFEPCSLESLFSESCRQRVS